MPVTRAVPDSRGIIRAQSKSNRYCIILTPPTTDVGHGSKWTVHTIRTGTHDMGPHTRDFAFEHEARRYANHLYRTS